MSDSTPQSPINQEETPENNPNWHYQRSRLMLCLSLYVLAFAVILAASRNLKIALLVTLVVFISGELWVFWEYLKTKIQRHDDKPPRR